MREWTRRSLDRHEACSIRCSIRYTITLCRGHVSYIDSVEPIVHKVIRRAHACFDSPAPLACGLRPLPRPAGQPVPLALQLLGGAVPPPWTEILVHQGPAGHLERRVERPWRVVQHVHVQVLPWQIHAKCESTME